MLVCRLSRQTEDKAHAAQNQQRKSKATAHAFLVGREKRERTKERRTHRQRAGHHRQRSGGAASSLPLVKGAGGSWLWCVDYFNKKIISAITAIIVIIEIKNGVSANEKTIILNIS